MRVILGVAPTIVMAGAEGTNKNRGEEVSIVKEESDEEDEEEFKEGKLYWQNGLRESMLSGVKLTFDQIVRLGKNDLINVVWYHDLKEEEKLRVWKLRSDWEQVMEKRKLRRARKKTSVVINEPQQEQLSRREEREEVHRLRRDYLQMLMEGFLIIEGYRGKGKGKGKKSGRPL